MNFLKYGILICLTALLYCCGDFLEESSQDEVRPTTLEDLKQLMLKEAYPLSSFFIRHVDFLTDDMESAWPGREDQITTLNDLAPVFTWDVEMDQKISMNYWKLYYEKIKGCNVVLDMLDDMSGSEADRENMRGQALALRAYYYLMLVNLYGLPYNAEGADLNTSLGVPLILSSSVTDTYPERNTLAEVYGRIESDLLLSLPLLERYGTQNVVFRVTDCFAHAVLARMYLYQERWDRVIEHADYVIQKKGVLSKLTNMVSVLFGVVTIDLSKNVYDVNSVENIWSYSRKAEYDGLLGAIGFDTPPAYRASEELYNLYEYDASNTDNFGDLRARCFYQMVAVAGNITSPVTRPYYGNKGNTTMSWNSNKGIRVAELYLSRAEAVIRLALDGQADEELLQSAVDDLNYLREARYDTRNADYIPVEDFAGTEDLLRFCLEERRRELSFEDHRWFDLRRYGMPEIKHTITLSEGNPQEYTLSQGDRRYVLQIPKEAMDRNYKLKQNPI